MNKDHFPVLSMQEFGESWTPDLNLLYHELKGARQIEKAHKHDFFIIMLFESGNGTHTIDFKDYPVSAHQVHLVFPGQVHKWNFGRKTVAHQLMVSRTLFESFSPSFRFTFAYYRNHPIIDLTKNAYQQILNEIIAVKNELGSKQVLWELIRARNEVIALLVSKAAEKQFKELDIHHTHPILNKFLSLIDRHFKEEHSVSFYAGQLNITPNYLNILSKKHFKVPATYLIQSRAVLEAKRLLQASDLSIKEIGFELGFYDHAYFTKFFKSLTGTTPTTFRLQS